MDNMTDTKLYVKPMDIEKRSFEIIESEMPKVDIPMENISVLKRVIHTTADFDYVDNLKFSENVVNIAVEALKRGATIITDTTMAMSGINKKSLEKLSGKVYCYIGEEEVAAKAKEEQTTRSAVSMEKAAKEHNNIIYVVGNAPTALIKIYELIKANKVKPLLIIGVPVGFVNVVEAKEMIMELDVPYIVAKGRKGGSNVAAAICNALIYKATKERE